ncbi:MAG: FtsK/SpoIIIE domain-containing protein, partial [Microthrixaceae bacterium]
MTDGLFIRVTSGPDRGLTTPIDGSVMLGREGNIRLSDSTVSRRHCRIDVSDSGLTVTDLQSLDGTRVNGDRIDQTSLSPGDLLKIGATTMVVLRLSRYSDAAASDAVLVAINGREVAKTIVDQMTVGRDPQCDISTEDPTMSRNHAVFHISGSVVEIEDLASSNHTFMNGAPVDGRARLADGDVLTFGRSDMSATFRSGPSSDDMNVRVSLEGDESTVQMSVAAPTGATVAQATAAIAAQVPTTSQQTLLYRPRDGALLHPDDLWHATGIWSGEQLVLGEGDASELAAARGRKWPTRQPRRINQLPRTVDPVQVHHVGALEVPETTSLRGRGMVWQIAGGLGAVLIGLTLAIVNPSYAIFGLITGGIGIVSILASIFGDQSRRRHKVTVFLGRIDELDDELDNVRQSQSARLFDLYPEIDALATRIAAGSPRIWERRPSDHDALEVRIGTGTRPAAIDIEEPRGERSELTPLVDELGERHRWLSEVPITVPSTSLGSFGVTGTRQNVRGLLNRMILEAATQLPPDQLRIWVAGTDNSWEWCRWFPQVPTGGLSSSNSGANEVLLRAAESLDGGANGTRNAGGAGGLFGPVTLIVIPDSTIRYDVAKLIGRAQDRTLVIVGSDDQRQLPGGVAAFLAIHDQDGRPYGYVTGRYRNAPEGALWVDVVETRRAEALAIELARITGAREASGSGGLVELLGLGTAADVDVAESWKHHRSAPLTVAVGAEDSGDPVTIGIRRDGPHGMIAGTTGSGKSELLQSVITALVLQNPPDRLNLFLIDFKGGSTFAQFGSLPHVVGMVTDIENDETLAERAFTSLDAEIDRRKRLLDSARVSDIKAYEALGKEVERLPNLLVVIDEFALLVQRLPGVKSRLDTVATQGRSLGIHLLLATQSPAGAITHAIRTNTNLWICLRVVADSESMEILGTRDAARIPDGSPGVGIIRLGAGDSLRSFRAARIARPVRDETSAVRAVRLDGASPHREASGSRTELDLVVEAVGRAAQTEGIEPARSLWLEPLPSVLTDEQLAEYSNTTATDGGGASQPPSHLQTAVGLTEDLRRQQREPHVVDLTTEGHLLVTGVFGSGRTTTLRRIASDLTGRFAPEDLHLYGIDGGAGALQQIRPLVNVGEVVRSDDSERLGRLVDRLGREVARRRELLAEASGVPFV